MGSYARGLDARILSRGRTDKARAVSKLVVQAMFSSDVKIATCRQGTN